MARFGRTVRDSQGNTIPNATVKVYLAGTLTFASIFSDAALTVAIDQAASPLVNEDDGTYEFFVATGTYKIVVSHPSIPTETYDNVDIGFSVPAARLISTDSPLTGGGDLSADRTLGVDHLFDSRAYASLQAAIDAAEVAGGTVLVQEDVTLTTPLTINGADVSLVSYNRSKITTATSIARLLLVSGATRCRVRGLWFDGAGNLTADVVNIQGSASDVVIEDCELESAAAQGGVVISGASKVRVRQCDIHNCLNLVRCSGVDSTDIEIWDNDLHDYGERAAWVLGTATVHFEEVKILDNRVYDHDPTGSARRPIAVEGVDANPHQRVIIEDNVVVGGGTSFTDGVTPGTGDQIAVKHTNGFRVVGNVSILGGDNGIAISQQASRGVVSGNVCEQNDTNGIQLGSSSSTFTRDVAVVGNACSNNGQNRQSDRADKFRSGIKTHTAQDLVIDGNVCGDDQGTGTQQHGINIENSTNIRIGINQFSGNGVSNIDDEATNTGLEIAALHTWLFVARGLPAAGTTVWSSPAESGFASQGHVSIPAPFAGFARSLQVAIATAPGAGESIIITLNKAAVATSLTATISGTSTTAADDTNLPTFAKGDLLSFSFVASNNGSYAGGACRCACELVKLAD